MVNRADQVYVERRGKVWLSPIRFWDDAQLMQVIERIVAPLGRRIDESSPKVDARLPDGSRVNTIIPPLALRGPCLTIRKFGRDPYLIDDLVGFGSLTEDMVRYLRAIVHARLNVMIAGGTGAGKTTLLNCLTSFIPQHERILIIEDSAELQPQQPHVVPLETRQPDVNGQGEITPRDLV